MFSEELKKLRKSRGLTQEELAKILGVPRSTFANYEAGAAEPKFEVAESIADFFNVPLDTLIGTKQIEDYVNDLKRTELKKAIFGKIVPDQMLDEVLEYAKFVENRGW